MIFILRYFRHHHRKEEEKTSEGPARFFFTFPFFSTLMSYSYCQPAISSFSTFFWRTTRPRKMVTENNSPKNIEKSPQKYSKSKRSPVY